MHLKWQIVGESNVISRKLLLKRNTGICPRSPKAGPETERGGMFDQTLGNTAKLLPVDSGVHDGAWVMGAPGHPAFLFPLPHASSCFLSGV